MLDEFAAKTQHEGIYCPVSKLQFAPPPAFCMISLGSIVQRNLEILSMLEPAAPSEGTPAVAAVAPTSLASRRAGFGTGRRADSRRDLVWQTLE